MSKKHLFYLWAFLLPCILSSCVREVWNITPGSIIYHYSISFDQSSLDLKKGDTCTLNVKFNPSTITDKKLTWQSSDTTVVKVDSVGKVTALDLGESVVTAESAFDQIISCLVIVRGQVVGEFEDTPTGGNGGTTGEIEW